jgi:hypothetical protein
MYGDFNINRFILLVLIFIIYYMYGDLNINRFILLVLICSSYNIFLLLDLPFGPELSVFSSAVKKLKN